MSRRWSIVAWAAAALAVVVVAATTSAQQAQGSPVPSVDNAGPQGARVLFTWLGEAGFAPRGWHAPLVDIPSDVRTVIVAEPRARAISSREVEALKAWVNSGGWLVYLAGRTSRTQGALESAFHLSFDESFTRRFGGFLAEDETSASRTDGLMSGVGKLAINTSERWSDESVGAADRCLDQALTLCEREIGQGRVVFAAGTDLIENHRLQRAGNAQWWANLASRGPMLFDEFHHHAEPGSLPLALWLTLLQLGVCGLLAAVAAGARMGAARTVGSGRSRVEPSEAARLGARLRRAHLAGPVLIEARRGFFAEAARRLGLGASLPKEELMAAIAARCGISAADLSAWDSACERAARGVGHREFLRLTQRLAAFESRLTGPQLN